MTPKRNLFLFEWKTTARTSSSLAPFSCMIPRLRMFRHTVSRLDRATMPGVLQRSGPDIEKVGAKRSPSSSTSMGCVASPCSQSSSSVWATPSRPSCSVVGPLVGCPASSKE